MTFQIINIDAIRNAVLQKNPYPYMIIENCLHPDSLSKVVESFPALTKRGSFPLNAVPCSGHFDLLMKELQQPELRRAIGERFGLDLEDKPPMITVRGYTTERDGHIHVDSEDKLITFLLYLNPGWVSPDGKIRVLYNRRDLSPYAAELSPEAGHCLIFQVTRDCWHGHTVFDGERRSIQLNYVVSDSAKNRHLKRHTFSAFLKRLFRKTTSMNSSGPRPTVALPDRFSSSAIAPSAMASSCEMLRADPALPRSPESCDEFMKMVFRKNEAPSPY